MNFRNHTFLLLMVGILSYASPALAQQGGHGARGGLDRGLDQAVSQARELTGGRVLSAETREIDGRPAYIVRILTKEGKVERLRIDASTGERVAPRRRR